MKLRPKIDPHDYETKKGHVVRFLKAGDKVKVTIMFRGREQSRPELGFRLLRKLSEEVAELGFVEASPKQDGAAPGRIKFRDTNGDGQITLADRTIIGSPHPDFTGGLDLTFRRGAFELGGTIFGTFGNKIFDVQKEFYVFRDFSTNVRKDLLANSWTPVDPSVPRAQYTTNNPNPKYPILDINDTYSRAVSSYYVESGSYVRLTNLQLAYDVPQRYARWLSNARVYVQAENLFTITGYNGLDPALPAANVTGAAGDIRDQYRGVDRGSYPSSRTFSFGIITSF